jgi:hypothetical protein
MVWRIRRSKERELFVSGSEKKWGVWISSKIGEEV